MNDMQQPDPPMSHYLPKSLVWAPHTDLVSKHL